MVEIRRTLQFANKWIKGTVRVERRALIEQLRMRPRCNLFLKFKRKPRLADARFTRNEDDVPFATLGFPPAIEQILQLRFSAGERRSIRSMQGDEAGRTARFGEDSPESIGF